MDASDVYRDGVFHDVQLRSWKESLRPHMLVMKGKYPGGGRNPQCVVTVAKSLFDCILKEHPVGRQDRKSALELAIILRDLQRSKSMVRWIPHPKNDLQMASLNRTPFAEMGPWNTSCARGVLSFVDMEAELERRPASPEARSRSAKSLHQQMQYEDQMQTTL